MFKYEKYKHVLNGFSFVFHFNKILGVLSVIFLTPLPPPTRWSGENQHGVLRPDFVGVRGQWPNGMRATMAYTIAYNYVC